MLEVMYNPPQRDGVMEVGIDSAIFAVHRKPTLPRAGKAEPKQRAA